jgi:hypothetical protein
MFFQVLAILFGLLVHPASAATAQDVADQNDAQIAACSRIIEDKTTPAKDRLMALYNRGAAYQSKDSYSEAIADSSVLLERKAIALVYADRGFCYQRLHDYKRSIDDLTEALRLDPSLAQAHKWRGVSHVNLGRSPISPRRSSSIPRITRFTAGAGGPMKSSATSRRHSPTITNTSRATLKRCPPISTAQWRSSRSRCRPRHRRRQQGHGIRAAQQGARHRGAAVRPGRRAQRQSDHGLAQVNRAFRRN